MQQQKFYSKIQIVTIFKRNKQRMVMNTYFYSVMVMLAFPLLSYGMEESPPKNIGKQSIPSKFFNNDDSEVAELCTLLDLEGVIGGEGKQALSINKIREGAVHSMKFQRLLRKKERKSNSTMKRDISSNDIPLAIRRIFEGEPIESTESKNQPAGTMAGRLAQLRDKSAKQLDFKNRMKKD